MTFCSIFRIYLCSFFWIECIPNDLSPRMNQVKNLLFHYQLMNYSCALSVHKNLLFALFSHTQISQTTAVLSYFAFIRLLCLILVSQYVTSNFFLCLNLLLLFRNCFFQHHDPTTIMFITVIPHIKKFLQIPLLHNISSLILAFPHLSSLQTTQSLLFIHSHISCANINVLQMTQSQKWISFLLVVGHRPVRLNIKKAMEGRRKHCFDIGSN